MCSSQTKRNCITAKLSVSLQNKWQEKSNKPECKCEIDIDFVNSVPKQNNFTYMQIISTISKDGPHLSPVGSHTTQVIQVTEGIRKATEAHAGLSSPDFQTHIFRGCRYMWKNGQCGTQSNFRHRLLSVLSILNVQKQKGQPKCTLSLSCEKQHSTWAYIPPPSEHCVLIST